MSKLFKRLIVFFVGTPALLSIVLFLPYYNHLALNLVTIAFSILGALEFRAILAHKNLNISVPHTIALGALSPVAWTIAVTFGITNRHLAPCIFIAGGLWLLISRVFSSQEKLDGYISRITAGFSVMVYPGLFMAWIVKMTQFNNAGFVILIYFLIVLLNDSFAWVFGVLFGKNNRGFVAASPNKSLSGFAGGLLMSIAIGIGAVALLPSLFTSAVMPSAFAGAVLGFVSGVAATLGDLCESAIKRSAGVKDSGTLILGRGGALDSIDSLAFAAPVYYMLYNLLFVV
ncbi:MAG: phosphatidate cytidylyltransferase [Treponema sp.]|nr:phosphatidate cytidylyltransferase [Treponema sp.]